VKAGRLIPIRQKKSNDFEMRDFMARTFL